MAVAALRATVQAQPGAARAQAILLGAVETDWVELYYGNEDRNAFAPGFVGRFERAGAATVLRGAYRIRPSVQLLMTAWLGFALCVAAYGFVLIMPSLAAGAWWWLLIPLAALALLACGLALIAFGREAGLAQQTQIDRRIRTALAAT